MRSSVSERSAKGETNSLAMATASKAVKFLGAYRSNYSRAGEQRKLPYVCEFRWCRKSREPCNEFEFGVVGWLFVDRDSMQIRV